MNLVTTNNWHLCFTICQFTLLHVSVTLSSTISWALLGSLADADSRQAHTVKHHKVSKIQSRDSSAYCIILITKFDRRWQFNEKTDYHTWQWLPRVIHHLAAPNHPTHTCPPTHISPSHSHPTNTNYNRDHDSYSKLHTLHYALSGIEFWIVKDWCWRENWTVNDYVFVRLSRIWTAASDLLHEVKIDAKLYTSKV